MAPAVLGYLRARGVDDPEAVTHDVFLAVLPHLNTSHGGEAGLRSLVFSIAHARAVDSFRQRGRAPVTISYVADSDERVELSAEERVVSSMGHSPVVALVEHLNPEQREVILLRIVADLPLESVATIMGKSVGSVKQLQRRALLGLKKQLAAGGRDAS